MTKPGYFPAMSNRIHEGPAILKHLHLSCSSYQTSPPAPTIFPSLLLRVQLTTFNEKYTFIFSGILRTFSGLFLHFPGVIYSRFGGVMFALSLQREQVFFSNQFIEFSCKNNHQVRVVLHRVPVKEIQSK